MNNNPVTAHTNNNFNSIEFFSVLKLQITICTGDERLATLIGIDLMLVAPVLC